MKVRYVIKFTKGADIKFIGHLDLMRTIQRIIRRSEVPIEYSKGFNPHMALSLAQPLSVGVYSDGEYMDIVLTEEMKVADLLARFITSKIENVNTESFVSVKREEMYVLKDNKYVPLFKAL